jgi:nitrate reductase NapE component
MGEKSQKLKEKAEHEIKEFLVIALYLWVVLGMFVLYKSVVLTEAGHARTDFVAHGLALINALVLAKFMLIARAFHLGERANDAPLIYPTLLKSALFAVVLGCCKVLEEAAVGYFRGKSFSESVADIGGGTLEGILTLTLILFVILIPLVAVGELNRLLPAGKLTQLFFHPREPDAAREPQSR